MDKYVLDSVKNGEGMSSFNKLNILRFLSTSKEKNVLILDIQGEFK